MKMNTALDEQHGQITHPEESNIILYTLHKYSGTKQTKCNR